MRLHARTHRASIGLVLLAFTLTAATTTAQGVLQRHQYVPACWIVGRELNSNLAYLVNQHLAAGDRFIELSTVGPGWTHYAYICGGNKSGSKFQRKHQIDTNVTVSVAVSNAQRDGMMITALAPYSTSLGIFTHSLREALPAGVSFTLVPSNTPTGIQQWLTQNPGYSPYSVDSVVHNQTRSYFVMAMASSVNGPTLRRRTIRFNVALGGLPSPSVPGGPMVIDIDQVSPSTYAAIIEQPNPGEVTPFVEVRVTTAPTPPNYCRFHAGLEREFAVTFLDLGTNGLYATGLYVNNGWSIYDVDSYPTCGPFQNYRGSMTSIGPATLGVASSTPGEVKPGSRLTFSITPLAASATAGLILGFDRQILDLAPFGAPGVALLPTLDLVTPVPVVGNGLAAVNLIVPNTVATRGLRVYAQGLIIDPNLSLAFPVATTSFYALTIL
ncbi:MAG: hypothetical protein H6836_03615 [Planctomycetes bacterium]|nr:hypothetical protein [Planctomycetota bacterium]MCB9888641.1 hypothetical protein [Planctomycetota bacterium]